MKRKTAKFYGGQWVTESLEEYRARRAARDRDFWRRMQPRQIWDSQVLGTYRRPLF